MNDEIAIESGEALAYAIFNIIKYFKSKCKCKYKE